MAKEYSAKDIQVLEGLDAVRKRPGMYIGSTGSAGMQHLIWEIVDNAVDEAIAGYCTRITVTLEQDGSVEVSDNGRGIPVDKETKTGLSAVEVVFTRLHAGGKFGGGGYQSAGGLHGVGASVVNALSERLDATVYRNGLTHLMSFHRGTTGVFSGPTPESDFTPAPGLKTGKKAAKNQVGTTVRFWPDRAIFHPDAVFETDKVLTRARQTAFLVPGLAIVVRDLTDPANPTEEQFRFAGGVKDMVNFLASGTPVCDGVHITGTGSFTETVPVLDAKGHMTSTAVVREVHVDVALRWDTGYETNVSSFVNVVATPKGGTHSRGFERGLVNAVRKSYDGTRLMKATEDPVTLDDCLEGLTAVVSVGFPEPQFEGQTKEVLGTPGVTKIVQDIVSDGVKAWVDSSKTRTQARLVMEKIANAARTRVASRTQREAHRRKTALEGAAMPAKLVDCRATGVDTSELFLVEGDSALGCLTGSTQVMTADGQSLSMQELARDWAAGITHAGYATDMDGQVVTVPLLDPRVTQTLAPLVQVTLSNGRTVRCTPGHPFRMYNGGYCRADRLVPGEPLMSVRSPASATGAASRLVNGPIAADGRCHVTAVTALDDPEDVYDLTVVQHHNFALDAGVFVHNSARQGRNSEFQALLPLRGKILNVQKASLADMLKNAECAAIIQCVGAGSGRSFDIEQMRYGRIMLMADADVDGSHIRTLLLTLFHRYMRPVIEAGRLYAAMPPLHKIEVMGRGGDTIYTYTHEEMERTVAALEKSGKKIKQPIQRYKGLGEMNADELWDTTMNPEVRSVRQITLDDAKAAETMLELAMGSAVEPRKDWIIANASQVNREAIDA
jgi:DNA gyrase/topoisomerase IV subunit B